MATEITVPAMGESVTEAILVRWLKNDGDHVALDEALCVLETDKADVELPSPAAGVLSTSAQPDATVAVGEAIGSIGESAGGAAAQAQASTATATPADPTVEPTPDDTQASPAVRRLLTEHGLQAQAIRGTGASGRLTVQDVELHIKQAGSSPAPPPPDDRKSTAAARPQATTPPRQASDPASGERREPMSRLRKRIAQRLVEVQQTTAMLTTFNEVDMQQIMQVRARHKEAFAKRHGFSLGITSFFASAACQALADFPAINARLDGEEVVYNDNVNLGMAVSTERGLVVPVIRAAQKLDLAGLEDRIKQVAAQAREGTLTLDSLSGGTFTITNGGVFGSLLSTPILNPPQSGILGLHAIKDRPTVVDGQLAIRPMMYLALSYDHRIVDGRESVSFLVRIKDLLEDPTRLLLDV